VCSRFCACSIPACTACQVIPRLTRQHRGYHFLTRGAPQEEPEDQDLNVVEMGEPGDEEVPFWFSLPRGQMTPIPEEEDNEDASLSGGPTLRSARLDFPAVVTLAAERVGLPLPPPLPPRPVSETGVLRPGASGAADLRLAPVARQMAVCGGDMAAAI